MSAFMLSFRRALLPALFAILLCVLPALADGSARTLPLTLDSGARAVDSCMDWLLDASGSLSVEEVASETMRDQFKALRVVPFSKEAGSLWLRFTLPAKSAEDLRPATLMLDMGPGVPGSPTLYVPRVNPADRSVQWQPQNPRQGAVFVLPEAEMEAQTCYIRLSGVPGPWLSPMLRSPHDAATALERMAHPAVLVALGMIILLCLLRSLGERGQWRIWAALYCGAALVHAWYGAPVTPAGHIEMDQAAAVIAPGLALMLLPHVGRQFMHTAHFSRMLDSQYMLLSLPGMLFILLPLVPTFAWTSRLLPLWPLGTLLFVPTTLGAWLGGLVGARRFLLGCLLPPVGTALGLALPTEMLPPDLLATAPMWGVVLGALIVAGSASVPLPQQHDADALPHMDADGLNLAPRGQDADEEIMTLGAPLNAPADDGLPRMDTPPQRASLPASSATTESLRLHLDSLLQQAAALRQAQLPSGPHRQAEQLEQALRGMQALLADAPAPQGGGQEEVFNLQRLLRDVHGRAQEAAEGKNTALSWYMPPHMGLWYKGNAALISDILDMLVRSAVQATAQGAIQISVRRMPESVNPGHLYFTITDTGTGLPPHDRPALALVRAWETAGAHHGSLSLECGPRGTSISFSLHLAAVRQDGAAPAAPDAAAVLIVDENPSNRQLLSFMLEDLPCATREARTPAEAAEQQAAMPAALIIMNGQLDAAGLNAVRAIRRTEQEQGAKPAVLLALTDSDGQWQPLRDAGFTHALPKPLTRKALRSTVRQLLPQTAPAAASVHAAAQDSPAREQVIPDLFGASSAAADAATAGLSAVAATAAVSTEQPQEHAGIPDLFGSSSAQPVPENRRAESAMPSLRMDAAPAAADMPAVNADAAALNLHMETAPAVSAERNAASFVQAAADAESMAQTVVRPAPRMAELVQETEDDDVILDLAEPVATAAVNRQDSGMTAGAAVSVAEQSIAQATEQPAVQAREQDAAAVNTAPLRDHETEAYVPDDSLSLDPDALRDPAIRLLKPTEADRLSAATAPRGPKLEMDAEDPASALTQNTALLPEQHGDDAPVVLSAPAVSAAQDVQHATRVSADAGAAPRGNSVDSAASAAAVSMASAPAAMPEAAGPQSAEAPQEPRVISAAEVRRSQAPKQETFSASLPEPAEAQDPVSAALQRVKALLGSRAKQPAPVMPEDEDDELRLNMPARAANQRIQPVDLAAADMQTAQAAQSAPRGQRAAMPAAGATPTMQQGTEDFTRPAPVQGNVSPTTHSPQPQTAQAQMGQGTGIAGQRQTSTAGIQSSLSATAAQTAEQARYTGNASTAQTAAVDSPSLSQPAAAPRAAQPAQTRASRYDPFDGLDEPIRQMLLMLDVNIVRARQAFQSGNTRSVSLLAAGIAQEAEKRGLRVLSRMGRCVESAAAAGDREALADLLPELEHAVERNRIAFTSEQ